MAVKFDNERTILKIHVLKLLLAILVVFMILLLYTTKANIYIQNYLGIPRQIITLILIAGYVFFYIWHLLVKSSYISFSDDGHKIVVRFYPLRPLNPPKSSIEIRKDQLYKYEINRTALREEVVLYQKVGAKISKYPPFSVTSLSKEEKEKLFKSLTLYALERK